MYLEILLGTTLLILISFVMVNKHPKGYPPGPIRFPIFGHIPYYPQYAEKGVHPLFTKRSKKYGPIIDVDYAGHRGVVMSDVKLIREGFNLPELCSRMHLPVILVRSGTDGVQRGIIFNDGQNWTDQRRFIVRHLRDFGLGKTSMESIIMDEAQELVQNLSKNIGKPISTQTLFNAAIINAIWTIVAGERFRHGDPKLAKLVSCVTQNLSETGRSSLIIFFMHSLARLFPNATGWNKYLESFYVTNNFIKEFVETRRQSHNDDVIADFTASYLQNINATTDTKSSFYGDEGIRNLVTVLDDIFSAGGETTSTTLTWLMLCMAMHPNVQEKVYTEINNVIGRNRLPSLADRSSMPYTEAMILETLRVSSVVPIGVLHFCAKDFNFNGYFIPKDTIITANFHGVHHDPAIWGDPENFRPERFLSPDENSVVKNEALMPFSVGKRACPGETLAKDEIFLIGTTIYQKFRVSPDPLGPHLTMQQKVNGLVAVPMTHQLIFNER